MNGHANGAGLASRGTVVGAPPTKGGSVDKAADFANYFCTYAFLYHQKEMLSDRVRMDAYYNAIFRNARHFQGKTVLDVGTGSGILAIWAAQAGAQKVYAVEATNMAGHARTVAVGNGVDHIVEVIEGSIEDINLPEKVDIIISEWMGYFLVRESMFDSVIHARDRWLKPNGMMYPSHARMWVAPMQTSLGEHKVQEYHNSMSDWSHFLHERTGEIGHHRRRREHITRCKRRCRGVLKTYLTSHLLMRLRRHHHHHPPLPHLPPLLPLALFSRFLSSPSPRTEEGALNPNPNSDSSSLFCLWFSPKSPLPYANSESFTLLSSPLFLTLLAVDWGSEQ